MRAHMCLLACACMCVCVGFRARGDSSSHARRACTLAAGCLIRGRGGSLHPCRAGAQGRRAWTGTKVWACGTEMEGWEQGGGGGEAAE